MTSTPTAGIGTPQTLPTTQPNLYHRNARRGDVQAIMGSLIAHGQFRPIVINRGTHTGRPDEVLAGNHTLMAIRQLAEQHPDDERWAQVDCWVVDVDDDRAVRIVLADNRTSDLGDYDNDTLLTLLQSVDHDLDGTGYDYDDLDDLTALLEADQPLPDNADDVSPPLLPSRPSPPPEASGSSAHTDCCVATPRARWTLIA